MVSAGHVQKIFIESAEIRDIRPQIIIYPSLDKNAIVELMPQYFHSEDHVCKQS